MAHKKVFDRETNQTESYDVHFLHADGVYPQHRILCYAVIQYGRRLVRPIVCTATVSRRVCTHGRRVHTTKPTFLNITSLYTSPRDAFAKSCLRKWYHNNYKRFRRVTTSGYENHIAA